VHAVCPKFLAFKGPLQPGHPAREDAEVAFPAGHYARLFAGLGVAAVVRLNDADTYDPAAFTQAGIRHHDLQFPDCTVPTPRRRHPLLSAAPLWGADPARARRRVGQVPPDGVVERFMDACSGTGEGALAVHCRAGLGRTGTLIGLWLMRHRGFAALEAIAWLRIVRPG
jgi:cell division cycle 14